MTVRPRALRTFNGVEQQKCEGECSRWLDLTIFARAGRGGAHRRRECPQCVQLRVDEHIPYGGVDLPPPVQVRSKLAEVAPLPAPFTLAEAFRQLDDALAYRQHSPE